MTCPFAVVPPTRPSRVANTRWRRGSRFAAVASGGPRRGPSASGPGRRVPGPPQALGVSTRRAWTTSTGSGSVTVRVRVADGRLVVGVAGLPLGPLRRPDRRPRTSIDAAAAGLPAARVSAASTRSTGASTRRAGRVSRPGAPASPWPSARAAPACARSGAEARGAAGDHDPRGLAGQRRRPADRPRRRGGGRRGRPDDRRRHHEHAGEDHPCAVPCASSLAPRGRPSVAGRTSHPRGSCKYGE